MLALCHTVHKQSMDNRMLHGITSWLSACMKSRLHRRAQPASSPCSACCWSSCRRCFARSSCRAARSAAHASRCPPCRQLALAHSVLQYHTARQALRGLGLGVAGLQGGQPEACRTMRFAGFQKAWPGLHHAQSHHMGRPNRPIPSSPTHLQRLAPVPSPAAGPPSHSKLAQRR